MTLDPRLDGKVALVTGGARRVGRAIALALADAGADVAITYRGSAQDAATLVEAVRARGRRALAIAVDKAETEAAARVHAEFVRHFDRLDVLVNNASTFEPTPLASLGVHEFWRQMNVNALTPLLLVQHFAGWLGAHYDPADPASPGRVINFIDIHVLGEPLRGHVAYNASKAALKEITATLALELAPRVTVNAVAPGVVAWPEEDGPEIREAYLRRVPLARAGTPEDAAAAVLYLAGPGSYCTGEIIQLDGGRLLT